MKINIKTHRHVLLLVIIKTNSCKYNMTIHISMKQRHNISQSQPS